MIWGYARCSTNEQKQDIKRQINELKKFGATDNTIFLEYESGTKLDRKELNKLLSAIKPKDTLVALEVSRITRSTKQLCQILELAQEQKLKLIFGTFVIDCSQEIIDPMSIGMLKMMSVFSELEAELIRARVKSGLEHAKSQGVILGRPKTTYEDIPEVFFRYLPKYKNKEINKSEFARLCNLSYPTIYKYLNLIEN
ncbi:MAG: recombinase family protein [Bacilli bacterium]|nr:recombinase family protein [Bacilli bacterium]MDD4795783.1 recombinase family protein [Bacilli bacterium]